MCLVAVALLLACSGNAFAQLAGKGTGSRSCTCCARCLCCRVCLFGNRLDELYFTCVQLQGSLAQRKVRQSM
uniref:Secreted protein n=1 Tax=Ascaris lumbricoides TaxID=6252 RepID=A0A0M3I5N5_ASCLU